MARAPAYLPMHIMGEITDCTTEVRLCWAPPVSLLDRTAETQKEKGTCLGFHAEILIAPELARQAAGSSVCISSTILQCLKEKCQLEAQKVSRLAMTVMDDYRGHEKESGGEARCRSCHSV